MIHKDKRSKLMNEYINGIKIIKYYGWENFAINTVTGVRDIESSFLY